MFTLAAFALGLPLVIPFLLCLAVVVGLVKLIQFLINL